MVIDDRVKFRSVVRREYYSENYFSVAFAPDSDKAVLTGAYHIEPSIPR